MQIRLETSAVEKIAVDALAVIAFEPEETKEGTAVASQLHPDPEITAQAGWMAELRASGEFTGKLYELAIL